MFRRYAKPKMMLEGLVAVVFGVCAFSTFYVVAVWMPRYAAAFGGMTEAESLTTISYYSIGSLVCVFAFAYLLKSKVRSVWAMTLNGLIACVASAVLYLYPSPFVCTAGAFLIGFSAAGGILQLGVAVMAEFFPDSKAKVTSVYMMMGGLANFVIPLATGYLSQISIRYVILLDFGLAVLTFLSAIYLFKRYYAVFRIPHNDLRWGERAVANK